MTAEPSQRPAPWRRALIAALLVLLYLALTLPGLGSRDLWDPNEPTHAEAAREMVDGGGWILPHVNARPYVDKPPLLHWLVALLWRFTGSPGAGWARLPGVLGGLLGVLAVWGIARLLPEAEVEGERAAAWSALVLATMGNWIWRARWIEPDALLAGLVAATLCFLLLGLLKHPAWIAASGLAAGLALLTKGPVALLPVAAAGPFLLLLPRRRRPGRPAWAGLGLLLCFAPAVLWMTLAAAYAGYRPADVLTRQVVERAAHGLHHVRPPWYYLSASLETMPWTLLLPGAVWSAVSDVRARGLRAAGPLFLLSWLLLPLAVLSSIPEKRGVYILPLYPAAALLVARLFGEVARGRIDPRWVRWPLPVSAVLVFLLAVALPWTASRELRAALGEASAVSAAMALGSVGGLLGLAKGRLRAGWLALALGAAFGVAIAGIGAGALDAEKSARAFSRDLVGIAGPQEVIFLGRSRPAVNFYAARTGPVVPDRRALLARVRRGGPALVVLDPEQALEAARAGAEVRILLSDKIGEDQILLARVGPPSIMPASP